MLQLFYKNEFVYLYKKVETELLMDSYMPKKAYRKGELWIALKEAQENFRNFN